MAGSSPTFTIEPMFSEDYTQCVDIACAAFTSNNPVTVHLGTPAEAFRQLVHAEAPCAAAVGTGLSLVARGGDGTLMAFLFLIPVEDANMSLPEHIPRLHHGLAVMNEIIGTAYNTAMSRPVGGLCLASLTGGKALRCAFGGTARNINGKGIGKALRLRAVEVARERGFRTLLVEPGHGATRHIWTAYCHGKIRAELPFDTFRASDGEQPCKGVEGSLAVCEVVVRPRLWDHVAFRPLFFLRLMWQTGDWHGGVMAVRLACSEVLAKLRELLR